MPEKATSTSRPRARKRSARTSTNSISSSIRSTRSADIATSTSFLGYSQLRGCRGDAATATRNEQFEAATALWSFAHLATGSLHRCGNLGEQPGGSVIGHEGGGACEGHHRASSIRRESHG